MLIVYTYKCICFTFPCSDPYTKLSLYDPVNGEITIFQTKTIKKVSEYTQGFFLIIICVTFDYFFNLLFLTISLHIDIGPKVEWRIPLESKCNLRMQAMLSFLFFNFINPQKKTLLVISLDLNLIRHWVRKFISYSLKKITTLVFFYSLVLLYEYDFKMSRCQWLSFRVKVILSSVLCLFTYSILFMLQVDPRKHRLLLEVFDENRLVKFLNFIQAAYLYFVWHVNKHLPSIINKGQL